MIAADQAVVSLYEVSSLTVEQIAETQDLDVLSVKACLMQNSILFREAVKVEVEAGFSDQQERDFLSVISNIAMDEEVDPHTRLRAAIYGREDKTGRRDVSKKAAASAVKGVNVTIIQFNQQLTRANEARIRALEMKKAKDGNTRIQEAIEVAHSHG